MNALSYQGVHFSEAMINGLAAAPGFFFYTKGGFPWIGSRVGIESYMDNFCRASGLEVFEGRPETPQRAYDEVRALLSQGIPVILQLDMRYLPYKWNEKIAGPEMSFGGHFIILIKLDELKKLAWVIDTSEPDKNNVFTVSLDLLMKARGSEDGEAFLHPQYRNYYFKVPQNWKADYEKGFKISRMSLIENYENEILENMKVFSQQIFNIESFIPSKYVLAPLFSTLHGWIEDFGIGGSGFRRFISDYYSEMENKLNVPEIGQLRESASLCAVQWTKLSSRLLSLSEIISDYYNDKNERQKFYQELADLSQKIYEAEY
ncbi:MAG: DUF4872 domain-containing protein [Spirochaetales bacterium]|nr:DUF4872 domain-containing protein [Spirochaetales bacterium]